METTIPEHTLLISWQLPYMVSDPTPERGDIVTFWSDELNKLLVKRVVGLPGDDIAFRDGYTYVNGEMLDEAYLQAGHYPVQRQLPGAGRLRLFHGRQPHRLQRRPVLE